jgi:hypothetical protein
MQLLLRLGAGGALQAALRGAAAQARRMPPPHPAPQVHLQAGPVHLLLLLLLLVLVLQKLPLVCLLQRGHRPQQLQGQVAGG